MSNWTQYTFVCDPNECDALLEFTARDGFGFPSGVVQITCPCGRQMSYVSATILPNNERNKMEETKTAPYSYDANALVTYKVINNGEASYQTLKVNELEIHLDSYRRLQDQLRISNNQISKILDNLNANGWYNPNTDKEDILSELCEILDHEPKQTVRINANVVVEVDYEIPLDEVEDFDAAYFVQDNLSIDSWHGDVTVNSFDVQDADVDWN